MSLPAPAASGPTGAGAGHWASAGRPPARMRLRPCRGTLGGPPIGAVSTAVQPKHKQQFPEMGNGGVEGINSFYLRVIRMYLPRECEVVGMVIVLIGRHPLSAAEAPVVSACQSIVKSWGETKGNRYRTD
jgi:hypothetical protein